LTITRRLWIATCTIVACVALRTIFEIMTLNSMQGLDHRRQGLRTMVGHVQSIQIALLQAESSQRGYLLTGRVAYLAGFNEAALSVHDSLPAVVDSIPKEYSLQVEQLRRAAAAKLSELDQTIKLRETGADRAAMTVVLSDRGKHYMSQARSLIHFIEAGMDAQLASNNSQRKTQLSRLLMSTFFFGTLILCVLTMTVFHVTYHLRRSVFALEERMADVGEDDVRPLVVTSADELDVLEAAFNRMIGRLRQLSAEGIRAQSRLRQAQKMEAIGQLTGGVAHDFNNLLAIIHGNLELLGDQKDAAPLTMECIEDALRAAERGADLTRRLLAYSRQQQLAPSAVDVGELVETPIRMLRRVVEESIVIETRIAPDLWTPWIDSQQLENALLNIALNARDAMLDGGVLTVAAENFVLDEEVSRLYAESAPGHYIVLSISDNGSGMTKDVLERVFEPFFTTKPLGSGTGLGLSMVYGFVKQSGGFVTIYSEPGFGTTVKVYLVEFQAQSVASPVKEATAPSAPRSGRVILVVEDDFSVRKLHAPRAELAGLSDAGGGGRTVRPHRAERRGPRRPAAYRHCYARRHKWPSPG
jgi:signal transduction histidine kinase